MIMNGTIVLGPTEFTHGHMFADEQFTTCSCSCSLDCLSLNRTCCVSESECGQCISGFVSDEQGECKEKEIEEIGE